MIPALLHGKLSREQENMEDILTSTVFGVLSYVPAEQGLLPFLRQTRTTTGQSLSLFNIRVGARVEYIFWRPLEECRQQGETEIRCQFCEPDLLLKFCNVDGERLYVLIEAKLHSGKSSGPSEDPVAPSDQLAKEWDNLVCLARNERAEPLLIFLTADFSIPADQIRESEAEYLRKRPGEHFACGWLSWRQIPIVFRDSPDKRLQDLVKLCERLNLRFFDQAIRFEPIQKISWRFVPSELQIDWLPETFCPFEWGYEK